MIGDLIHEIFAKFMDIGIVKSGNEFSKKMLGRSSRHYSWLLSSGHEPALDVMLGLYVRIDDLRAESEAAGDTSRALILHDMAGRLWTMIRKESLIKGPRRRKQAPADDARAGD